MEVILFMVTLTLIMSLALIAIGIIIGEDIYKRKLYNDNNNNILYSGNNDSNNNTLGNDKREIDNRSSVGFIQQMTNERLANIIRAMKATGICPSQYEKIYLDEAANRLEGHNNGKN